MPQLDKDSEPAKLEKFSRVAQYLAMLATTIGLAAAMSSFLSRIQTEYRPQPVGTSIEDRIAILNNVLKDSATAIRDIEQEVTLRRERLAQLKQDAETAKALAELNKDKADAVLRALEQKLEAQDRKSFWWNQVWAFGYTLLGVVLGWFSPIAFRYLRARWKS